MKRGSTRTVLLAFVALLLVVVAVGSPREGGEEPLDPASTEPDGTRALVLTLEELGASVDVVDGPPSAGATAAIVLRDRLTDDDRDDALRWVAGGTVLLVADPSSPLTDGAVEGPCPPALSIVEVISFDEGDRVRRGEGACFDGTVASRGVGDGDVVAIASPSPFTNDLLDDADNAVLAAALLAPTPGAANVAVLDGPSVEGAASDDGLFDLVSEPVRQSLLEAGLAVLLWVLWRARRLGRPVPEEQPVAVAGSELVVAVGRLLDARRRPDEAAASLRADVRRTVDRRLGLPPGADVRAAAAAVASYTHIDESRAAAALGDRPVHTDDDLLEVAADLDRIRSELLGDHP